LISDLSLYDIQHTKGVGADLSHIETRAKVKAFVGKEELANALKGIDLVVIPAGVPRKPGNLILFYYFLVSCRGNLVFKV
jgi:malate dehydrogenase